MAVFSLHHFRLLLNRCPGVFLLSNRIKPILLFKGELRLKKVQFKDKLERGVSSVYAQARHEIDIKPLYYAHVRLCYGTVW